MNSVSVLLDQMLIFKSTVRNTKSVFWPLILLLLLLLLLLYYHYVSFSVDRQTDLESGRLENTDLKAATSIKRHSITRYVDLEFGTKH